jgi:Kdo2-lipid IVA lauroyltransferase/acyltransferase
MVAWLAYSIADVGTRWLPTRWANALAVAVARAYFAVHPPARTTLEANLQRLHPGLDPPGARTAARAAFAEFSLSFLDFLRLARMDRSALERAVEIRGREHLEAAMGAGRGVIVLSAHVGNWEWGAALLGARNAMNVVARPHANRRVEALFSRRRVAWGVRTLEARPPWQAARALRRREWVALMSDRAPHAGGSAAARVPVCAWVAALARRTGALVLPATIARIESGRYAACFDPPLSAEACRNGALRDVVRGHLRRHPHQWFAFEPLPEGLA